MIPVCGQTQMWSTPTSKCLCGSQLVHVRIPVLYCAILKTYVCVPLVHVHNIVCCCFRFVAAHYNHPWYIILLEWWSLTYLQWHLALSVFLVLNLKLRNNSSTAYNNKSSIQHWETHSIIKFYFKLTKTKVFVTVSVADNNLLYNYVCWQLSHLDRSHLLVCYQTVVVEQFSSI